MELKFTEGMFLYGPPGPWGKRKVGELYGRKELPQFLRVGEEVIISDPEVGDTIIPAATKIRGWELIVSEETLRDVLPDGVVCDHLFNPL